MSEGKHWETAPEDIIPFVQKLGYGIGQLANNFYTGALGVFMVVLVMGLKMDPFLAGILAAAPRIFDAITDPIMGYVSDNIRTRWGRRKPFIALGGTITGIAFMLMWQIDPEASMNYNFWYFLGLSLLFYLGYTIFATPLIGLGYEMTPDYHERTRLMAFAGWFGNVAWMIVPWFWVLIYMPSLFENHVVGVHQLSIWVGGFCVLISFVPALLCKERLLTDKGTTFSFSELGTITKDFFKGIGETLSCKPFLQQCGATFLVFNGFQTIAQFSFFIIIFYLFNGDYGAAGHWPAWMGTIGAIVMCILVIPIVTWMANKYGKRNAFIYSTFIALAGYALKWWCYDPATPWLMLVPVPLQSFSLGGLFLLMGSMTADVCDLDELQTGNRRESTFGAVYWWTVKLGQALALFTSGVVIKLVGFDQGAATQTVETMNSLRIADIIVPVATSAFALVIMWKYDLTEEKAHEIRGELEQRRGKVKHQGEEAEA